MYRIFQKFPKLVSAFNLKILVYLTHLKRVRSLTPSPTFRTYKVKYAFCMKKFRQPYETTNDSIILFVQNMRVLRQKYRNLETGSKFGHIISFLYVVVCTLERIFENSFRFLLKIPVKILRKEKHAHRSREGNKGNLGKLKAILGQPQEYNRETS